MTHLQRSACLALFASLTYSQIGHCATELHRYQFKGNSVSDSVGTATGALLNGATIQGGSLVLDGQDDYVQFAEKLVPTGGAALSLAFFAQQTSPQTGAFAELISQGASQGPGFYVGQSQSRQIRVGDSWATTVVFPSDGQVHHFAVTASSTNAQLFIDGALAATKGSGLTVGTAGTDTRFGRQFGANLEYFAGRLADVRIFSGVLTAAEVRSLRAPTVSTTDPTGITTKSATLNGTINPNTLATTAAFEYGLTSNYGASIAVSPGGGALPVPVTAGITGLLANRTYHYRLVAGNAAGLSATPDATFDTDASPPFAATAGATNVTNSTATVNGRVNPNGSATNAIFEYGTTTSYGTGVIATPAPGNDHFPVNVSANLSGLQPNQTYHYRLRATNSAGSVTGDDGTFTTGATAAAVTTGGFSGLGSTSITLGGTVNPNGSATTAAFEYGLDLNYGSTASSTPPIGSENTPVAVSATISNLVPNRTYHYRLTATNAGGLVVGAEATFTTPPILPAVTTLPPSELTNTTTRLHGTVNPMGSTSTAQFVYRKIGGVIQQTATVNLGDGTSDIPLEAALTELEPFTDYEYRVEATNTAGTALGSFVPFKTAFTPLVPQPDKMFVSVGGAELTADILKNDEGTGLFISSVTGSRVSINSDQKSISFSPSDTSGDSETFTYTVTDVAGNVSAQTLVSVYYFEAFRGTYFNGVTSPAGTVLRLQLDVDFAGFASGRLDWDEEQYPFKAQLDSEGKVRIERARPGANTATLVADLALDPGVPNIDCTFQDLSSAAPDQAAVVLAFLPADPAVVPAQGLQVIFIDPGTEGADATGLARGGVVDSPGGIGFTLAKVRKKSKVRFVTKMPDFGAFSTSSSLQASSGGALPKYQVSKGYKTKSGLVGQVAGSAFAGRGQTGADRLFGTLDWTSGSLSGLIAQLDGYAFKNGVSGVPFGFDPTKSPNATVRLARGGLLGPIEFPGTIKNGKLTVSSSDPAIIGLDMAVSFKLTGGSFNGSFLLKKDDVPELAADEKVKVKGGVAGDIGFNLSLGDKLQPRARGSFHVKSTLKTGRIEITPR